MTLNSNYAPSCTLLSVNLTFCRIDVRKYFFSERVVKIWNALPPEPQHFAPLLSFKNFVNDIDLTCYQIGFWEYIFGVRPWLHVKQNICKNVLEPSTSRGSKTFLQMFCKCFILHVPTSKNVLAAVKILQNIFSGLVLVARYSWASVISANHSLSLARVRMTSCCHNTTLIYFYKCFRRR